MNPNARIFENSRYLKSIADESVITGDVGVSVMDRVSTNVTIPTNVTRTVSINPDNRKVIYKIDYYILHTFLLVTKIISAIDFIFYH